MKKYLAFLRRPTVMLLIGALLAALPLTFPSLFLLSWISTIPFFLVLLQFAGRGNGFRALGRGLWFGFFFHFFVYFWFLWLYPLDFTGLTRGQSFLVVALAWLGISLLHGALYAIPTLLVHWVSQKIHNRVFLVFLGVFGIVAAQRLLYVSEIAFPWVRICLGQYRAPVLIQFASVLGMDGVECLILSVSALLALAVSKGNFKKNRAFILAAVLFVSNLFFGVFSMLDSASGETITVASVQGCILSGEKWDGSTSAYDTYFSLTEEHTGEEVDLVVWPESAVPINLASYPEILEDYQSLAEKVRARILAGCFHKIDGVTSNSAVLLDETDVVGIYSKRHLVPVGEKLPYRSFVEKTMPFLTKINMLSHDLASGKDSALMETQEGVYGVLICFESVFPELCLDSVRDGAEMLVVVTNDSWYEDSPGIWQHLAQSVFRSVETSRSIIRCANSGVSAFIDHNGTVQSYLGPLEQGVLQDEVSFHSSTTVYTVVGDCLVPVSFVGMLLWGAWIFLRERREKDAR